MDKLNLFGIKVKPKKQMFPNILSTSKEYCVLGFNDDYIQLIEWNKRGKYEHFLRVRYEDIEKDFEILITDANEIESQNDFFGKKIVFTEETHCLKDKELCLIGISNNSIAIIEWGKRGEYNIDYYSLSDFKVLEVKEEYETKNMQSCTQMNGVTEEQILVNLKKMKTKEVEDIAENYNYQWDENESTSRNLRELAEVMFNRES